MLRQTLQRVNRPLGAMQGPAVLHRLGHMRHLGAVGAGQVGDGAGNFQGTVRAAGRPAEPGGGHIEELGGGIVQPQVLVDLLALQALVGFALARNGSLARQGAALADAGGGLTWRCLQQVGRRQRGHVDVQVDAVEQRAAELALVALWVFNVIEFTCQQNQGVTQ
jgi:hypothetical protein